MNGGTEMDAPNPGFGYRRAGVMKLANAPASYTLTSSALAAD